MFIEWMNEGPVVYCYTCRYLIHRTMNEAQEYWLGLGNLKKGTLPLKNLTYWNGYIMQTRGSESLENAQSIASSAWDCGRNWLPEGRRRGELKEEIFWRGIQLIWKRGSARRQELEKAIRVYQIDAGEQFSSVGIYWVHWTYYCVEVPSLNNGTQIF